MLDLLWLIPAIPFAGALLFSTLGSRMPKRAVAVIGVGTIAASAVLSGWVAFQFLSAPPPGGAWVQALWTWISAGGFRVEIAFYLDALSLVMTLVVTFVSFLIHLYSAEFMWGSEGYSRFFAYMNLFVASMTTLLLADNLLLLYLGWEGVGLCSYLLIGFWYQDPANGRAGQKAFIVTRVGDTAMAIGLLLLFHAWGTLRIQELMHAAQGHWPSGTPAATAAAALLLGGAVGKSAQLPLQVWLPDAMAGPTPVSALIHAATMVTAGVYLIARTHVLFSLAPAVQFAVAWIGAATLITAGLSASVQQDIKRVLAYSTISQIGYMFLALGAGAWSAAIFHFATHAFFKALLFLGAGIVIEGLRHEHNIFRMGGLRNELPVAFWTFLAGSCSLSGLPLVTAGSYSKDFILWSAANSPYGSIGLWAAGIVGVALTSLYIFRVVFLVFWGPLETPVTRRPGLAMTVPVCVLAVLAIAGGLGQKPLLTFLTSALPALQIPAPIMSEMVSRLVAAAAFLSGLATAWAVYVRHPEFASAVWEHGVGRALCNFWFADWGMDALYDRVFVRPVRWIACVNRSDVVDSIFKGLANLASACYRAFSQTESGRLRWYAGWIAGGAVILMAIVIFL
jgi:NADH-quinone oxidoreductase subunit L